MGAILDESHYPGSYDEDDGDTFVLYAPPFSAGELRAQDAGSVTDWLLRFEGQSADQICEILRADWGAVTANTSRQFADFLLSAEVMGIGVYRNRAWVAIGERGSWRLLIPKPRELSAGQLEFIGGFGEPSLRDFCAHFHECWEWDPWFNSLWLAPESHTDAEFGGELSDWEGGMSIYHISSGDSVLLGTDGRLAHSLHELVWGGRVKEGTRHVLNSFDAFIGYYIQRLSGTLDPEVEPLFEGDYHGELDLVKPNH